MELLLTKLQADTFVNREFDLDLDFGISDLSMKIISYGKHCMNFQGKKNICPCCFDRIGYRHMFKLIMVLMIIEISVWMILQTKIAP